MSPHAKQGPFFSVTFAVNTKQPGGPSFGASSDRAAITTKHVRRDQIGTVYLLRQRHFGFRVFRPTEFHP